MTIIPPCSDDRNFFLDLQRICSSEAELERHLLAEGFKPDVAEAGAYIAVDKAIDLLREGNAVKNWNAYLQEMALNAARAVIRQRQRFVDGGSINLNALEWPARDDDGNSELLAKAAEAINRLPAADKAMLLSLVMKERTQTEIGDERGVSQEAISQRFKKITSRLRQELLPILHAEGLPFRAKKS